MINLMLTEYNITEGGNWQFGNVFYMINCGVVMLTEYDITDGEN